MYMVHVYTCVLRTMCACVGSSICVCVCTHMRVCARVHTLMQGALCAHTRPTDKPRLEGGSGGSIPAPRWVSVEETAF